MRRRTIPIGGLIMILVLALASLGVGYGLWFKVLTVEGVVNTGRVNAEFTWGFTDDDSEVNVEALDSQDTGDCPISFNGKGSCDPADTGRDPKAHYDKDVGQCFAWTFDKDEEQPGDQNGFVTIGNSYPSYHCTAWFLVRNNGSVPVKIVSVKINGEDVVPGLPTPLDLDRDEKDDIELHITDVHMCQQIEPNEEVWMDIDQHILQTAPQGAQELKYEVEVQLNQWNETPCGLLFAASDTEEFHNATPPDRLAVATVSGGTVFGWSTIKTDFDVNGLAPSGWNTLFSGDPLSNAQNEIEFNGALISSVAGPLPATCCNEDLAFDGTYLWRGHYFSGPLYKYLPDGTVVDTYDQLDLTGATFVGDTLWLSTWGGQQVGTFNPGSNTFTPMFGLPTHGGGLAYDAVGNILWVGRGGGTVEAWDLNTLTVIPGSAFKPFGDIPDTIDGLAFVGN
jgi:hypothetical protein